MRKVNLLLLVLLLISTAAQARSRKVLFIGNSYVYSNDIPNMIKQLALANGDTLIYDQNVPGGYTLQQHSTDATTANKIKAQKWDIVVLQEQSQRPSFSPGQVAADVYPYVTALVNLIRNNDTCTETMFYMTWGRKNGDASNCVAYPPICTYEGMQARLRESYLEMTDDNNAVVAPVGAAWKLVRDSLSSLELYVPDESHPSVAGSYLSACVFYASIFHRSPVGNTYLGGLSAADAQKIQYYAAKVAIDSVSKWQQHGTYTRAGYDYSVSGNKVTFTNTSTAAKSYSWDFGDGNTSGQSAPVHTYNAQGKYTVKFTAVSDCFSETITDTITIGSVGILNTDLSRSSLSIATIGNGSVEIMFSDNRFQQIAIYNTMGALIDNFDIKNIRSLRLSDLPAGIYLYRLAGQGGPQSGMFYVK